MIQKIVLLFKVIDAQQQQHQQQQAQPGKESHDGHYIIIETPEEILEIMSALDASEDDFDISYALDDGEEEFEIANPISEEFEIADAIDEKNEKFVMTGTKLLH